MMLGRRRRDSWRERTSRLEDPIYVVASRFKVMELSHEISSVVYNLVGTICILNEVLRWRTTHDGQAA